MDVKSYIAFTFFDFVHKILFWNFTNICCSLGKDVWGKQI